MKKLILPALLLPVLVLSAQTPQTAPAGKAETKVQVQAKTENNAPVKKSDRVGAVRSLHHIEDEDFYNGKPISEIEKI